MKFSLRPVAHHYRSWMDRWENELCSRATDRVVRPFEYGLGWTRDWPSAILLPLSGSDPVEYLIHLNQSAIAKSHEFFGYEKPTAFELQDDWLAFTSAVRTPFRENNRVWARWFPARTPNRRAVVVLPHWNVKLPQHNALCAGLQRLGISALRLSLPYHDSRMPAGLSRADYAVASNICRTIDAARQAVIDTRSCFAWLAHQGF